MAPDVLVGLPAILYNAGGPFFDDHLLRDLEELLDSVLVAVLLLVLRLILTAEVTLRRGSEGGKWCPCANLRAGVR